MKKSFLLTGGFMITLGVFMALGTVLPAKPALALQAGSASTAEVLQPAEEVVYNEELRVNGTGRFNSVYIGQQGIGGVTFFNGTIVNSTTNNGGDNPVTFGDGVRIDGEIWRTEKGGDNPLKISDHVMPTLHNMNDMGIEGTAWRNMYYADTLHGGSADLSGDLDVNGVATIGDNLVVVGTATFGGGYGNSGITLHSNGDLEMDADLTVDGNLTGNMANFSGNLNTDGELSANTGDFAGDIDVYGNIDQDRDNGGAVKAVVYIDSGTCTHPTIPANPERSWTYNNSTPTCTSTGAGTYTVDFNFTSNDRFWQVTTLFPDHLGTASSAGSDKIQVDIVDKSGVGTNASPFMLTIY